MLESMKVVSFCHVLQGPACTQYLADMGADVIKVEPLEGERARRWQGRHFAGVSGLYLCAFRNKRLFAVDLKTPDGLKVVLDLIKTADVVVENFRQGVMERLGLSYEALKEHKPDLIYASGTGWGTKGPVANRESQDILVQARTGLMAATGNGTNAKAVGSAVVDQHGGALLAMGIVAAYVKKLKTGKGTRIEGSLYTAGLDLQTEPLTVYLSSRPGNEVFARDSHLATWYHQAPYGVYELVDAEIAISVADPEQLAEALDSNELRALSGMDRFADRDAYAQAFARAVAGRRFEDVSRAFDNHKIWYSKVFNFDDVADDPQAKAIEAFREIDVKGEKAVLVNHPLRYDGEVTELKTLGFDVGQHTREILAQLGYSQAKVEDLVQRGIVGAQPREKVAEAAE